MNYFKKTSIWVFMLIIALVMVSGYFFYNNVIKKTEQGLHAIPESSILFLENPDTREFIENINTGKQIWTSLSRLSALKGLSEELTRVDSMATADEEIAALLSSPSYLSFHRLNDSLYPLFILEFKKHRSGAYLEKMARKIFGESANASLIKISGQKSLLFESRDHSEKIYALSKSGLALISPNKELLTDALLQLNTGRGIAAEEAFLRVEKTKGKNVDAHLFFRDSKTGEFLSMLTDEKYRNTLKELDHFSGWTELDVILKKEELLMNGYTASTDSSLNYLNCFSKQSAPEVSISSVLPFNTNFMLHMGFEDFASYYAAYENHLKALGQYQQYYAKLAGLNNKYQINLENNLLSWIGKEVALAGLASEHSEFSKFLYVVIQTEDPLRANQQLTSIMHNVQGSGIIKNFKDHLIKKINLPDLFRATLGEAFGALNNPYYTQLGEYVVFANNVTALEEFINLNIAGKSLDDNINYQEFSDNISETSNLYLYFNTRNALKLLSSFCNPSLSNLLESNSEIFGNFHAFALQFSYINDMYYTNTYLRYNEDYREENRAVWMTELDAPIIRKPFLVRDHTDNTYNIIVFDEDQQMYLIDNHGNILWKISYAGNLMSKVYPVDFYKNRKVQYLFNTDEYIYLIDLLGRKVANYPMKLGTRASNGLAVFDYVSDKDYRLVFAGEDRRIYNYTIDGNSVQGWKTPRMNEKVNKSIQHLVAHNKDYIIIPMEDGSVEITDRRGKTRIRIRDEFNNALNSDFYTNETNSKGIIITTDVQGHLTYIKINGRIDRTVFKDFSEGHYFLYEDLDKRNGEDFIFLDGDHLLAFDRYKNNMIDYRFPDVITQKPEIIHLSNRENLLGIVSASENKLYLFDGKGNIVFDAGLTGSTNFAVGNLNNDDDLNLVIGNGNMLYNYLIK